MFIFKTFTNAISYIVASHKILNKFSNPSLKPFQIRFPIVTFNFSHPTYFVQFSVIFFSNSSLPQSRGTFILFHIFHKLYSSLPQSQRSFSSLPSYYIYLINGPSVHFRVLFRVHIRVTISYILSTQLRSSICNSSLPQSQRHYILLFIHLFGKLSPNPYSITTHLVFPKKKKIFNLTFRISQFH